MLWFVIYQEELITCFVDEDIMLKHNILVVIILALALPPQERGRWCILRLSPGGSTKK